MGGASRQSDIISQSTNMLESMHAISSDGTANDDGWEQHTFGFMISGTPQKTDAGDIPGPSRSTELNEWEQHTFERLISTELSSDAERRVVDPSETYPRQEQVLAVHWHPEFIPINLIRRRLATMFPNCVDSLVIPTQHNILTEYDEFAGVEVDCFSRSFNRKVQLLVHFEAQRVREATVFRAMLAHTFKYRSRQLFEFVDCVVDPSYEHRLQKAADRAGADEDTVEFVRTHTAKLKKLLELNEHRTPVEAIRNKIVFHYFEALRPFFETRLLKRSEALLRAVKRIVKENFSNEFFYATNEVIEEVRSLGGGIVIPHPEQFWPILLAEYDVDGYEVWNPQSQQYTEFQIRVVHRLNKSRAPGEERLLIFMGDDCHMGEKVKPPQYQDPEKAGREIGVQPAWEDQLMRKSLIVADADRHRVIEEYRARLLS